MSTTLEASILQTDRECGGDVIRRVRRFLVLIAVVVMVLSVAPAALADTDELPPGGTFVDDDLLPEEGFIEAIAAAGITRGCNPPVNNEFCPERILTRAEMASIFVRALRLPAGTPGQFADTTDSVHEADIDALATAGITKGCNPPANDRFCPDRRVSREEMAAFVVRAFDLPAASSDHFSDDDGSIFENDINAIGAAGITKGCRTGAYCPTAGLTRSQMAVFMGRALHLTPMVPPERPPPPYPQVGHGKRIIYSNSQQRIWLIDANEHLVDTYLVSGKVGVPRYATYRVFSKSVYAHAPYGGITMKYMVRFVKPGTFGNAWSYGFHTIPRYSSGQPLQTEDQLGTHRSGGCVRQADHKAKALYEWAPIGTTVHAIP
ncbi:MAG: L,D-transpeptidase family protein [Actinomycetota bacterium]|nr:L,D-transpeptidase family protein [Actinomycetota bacterium]